MTDDEIPLKTMGHATYTGHHHKTGKLLERSKDRNLEENQKGRIKPQSIGYEYHLYLFVFVLFPSIY
jgi:hypothetical protein